MFSIESEYRGSNYRFDVYDKDFNDLDNDKISQTYGIIYNNKREILLVHNQHADAWILIGGTVEKGESLLDCLKRECMEEGAVTLDFNTIKPFFYQEVYKVENGQNKFLSYQVRYLVKVEKEYEFKGDPDGSIDKILWVSIEDIPKYLKWPKTTEFIVDKLKKEFNM